MIVSDQHRLIFVHIPKCAGVSVKQPLRAIDSTAGFFSRIGDHEAMGRVHFAHLPLRDLADYFPDVFAKLGRYSSFAVARDPRDRFVSAIFQRLREFKHLDQSAIDRATFEAESQDVIAQIAARGSKPLGLELVHFNRQVDFVELDGQRVVERVFALERLNRLQDFVRETAGIEMAEERKNRSTEFRYAAMRPFIRALKAPYAAIVPYAVRNRMRSIMLNHGLYADVDKQRILPTSGPIHDFVQTHYADDFRLHRDAL